MIVTSNCLEHFDDPVALIRQHLQSCGSFYAAMVPYREGRCTRATWRSSARSVFPSRSAGSPASPPWLSIAAFLAGRESNCSSSTDRIRICKSARLTPVGRKSGGNMGRYYAVLPMFDDDGAARGCSEESRGETPRVAARGEPRAGGRLRLGLAEPAVGPPGKLQLTLMDFSQEALDYAKRGFAEHSLSADFVCQDVFAPGEAQYDLVFNAGAFANYAFDEQVAFLRGMASRSRKYVLAVSPNPTCYWYWVWRMQRSSRGEWPFGKEAPIADLATSFQAAGLTFLGQMYGDGRWSESFLKGLDGLDDSLREELLALHRTAAIPEQWQCPCWWDWGARGKRPKSPLAGRKPPASLAFSADSLTASLADALAASVAAERRPKRLEASSPKNSSNGIANAAQKAAAEEKDRQWQRQLAVEKEACDTLAGRLDAIEGIPAATGHCSRFGRPRRGWSPAAAFATKHSRPAGSRCTATSRICGGWPRQRPAGLPRHVSACGWRPRAASASAACAKPRRKPIGPVAGSSASRAWTWPAFSASAKTARASSSTRRSSTGVGCVSGRTN